MQKNDKNSASAGVFTNRVPNFLGVAYKNVIFAENPIEIWVSAYLRKEKGAQKMKKVESKIWPRLSQKSVQVCCAT